MRCLTLLFVLFLSGCVVNDSPSKVERLSLWPYKTLRQPPLKPLQIEEAPDNVFKEYVVDINSYFIYVYGLTKEANEMARKRDMVINNKMVLCRKFYPPFLNEGIFDIRLTPYATNAEDISKELADGISNSKKELNHYRRLFDSAVEEHESSCTF